MCVVMLGLFLGSMCLCEFQWLSCRCNYYLGLILFDWRPFLGCLFCYRLISVCPLCGNLVIHKKKNFSFLWLISNVYIGSLIVEAVTVHCQSNTFRDEIYSQRSLRFIFQYVGVQVFSHIWHSRIWTLLSSSSLSSFFSSWNKVILIQTIYEVVWCNGKLLRRDCDLRSKMKLGRCNL